jgi:hypothetical protein
MISEVATARRSFTTQSLRFASLSTVEDLKGTIDVGHDDVVVAIAGESNSSFDRQVFVIVAERVEIARRVV